jgi:hypothetical protein
MTTQEMIAAIAEGDEALDRGGRGPGIELDLLRAAGLIRAPLPSVYGGKGWGTYHEGALPLFDMLHALGGASLPIARIYEGHVNAIRLIADHGTPDQLRRISTLISAGAIAGVWGADSVSPVTIANGKLAGAKAFASGLGDVSIAVITATTQAGLQMVIADVTEQHRHDHGSWDVMAMVGSRSGRFDCTGMTAPRNALLGTPDSLFTEPAFHGGIWRILAAYAGAMGALADALARRLGSDADPIAWHRLGEVVMEAETANVLARKSCLAVEGAAEGNDAVATVLLAREAIEQAAQRQFTLIERMTGTAIHSNPSQIGRIVRNLRFYLRQAQLDGKLALATSLWVKERHTSR